MVYDEVLFLIEQISTYFYLSPVLGAIKLITKSTQNPTDG